MYWPWRRRRWRKPEAPSAAPACADLIQPDPIGEAHAAMAADVQAEATRLARLAAVLNEPTVVINRELRIPGYLARGWEADD